MEPRFVVYRQIGKRDTWAYAVAIYLSRSLAESQADALVTTFGWAQAFVRSATSTGQFPDRVRA